MTKVKMRQVPVNLAKVEPCRGAGRAAKRRITIHGEEAPRIDPRKKDSDSVVIIGGDK